MEGQTTIDSKAAPAYQPVQQGAYQPVRATGVNSDYPVIQMSQPGQADPVDASATYEPRPSNYMILAIITFCCCMGVPTIFCSVIAVIYSLQVDLAWEVGHRDGAKKASNNAKWFSIAAIITGVVITVIVGIIIIIYVVEVVEAVKATNDETNNINHHYNY